MARGYGIRAFGKPSRRPDGSSSMTILDPGGTRIEIIHQTA